MEDPPPLPPRPFAWVHSKGWPKAATTRDAESLAKSVNKQLLLRTKVTREDLLLQNFGEEKMFVITTEDAATLCAAATAATRMRVDGVWGAQAHPTWVVKHPSGLNYALAHKQRIAVAIVGVSQDIPKAHALASLQGSLDTQDIEPVITQDSLNWYRARGADKGRLLFYLSNGLEWRQFNFSLKLAEIKDDALYSTPAPQIPSLRWDAGTMTDQAAELQDQEQPRKRKRKQLDSPQSTKQHLPPPKDTQKKKDKIPQCFKCQHYGHLSTSCLASEDSCRAVLKNST